MFSVTMHVVGTLPAVVDTTVMYKKDTWNITSAMKLIWISKKREVIMGSLPLQSVRAKVKPELAPDDECWM